MCATSQQSPVVPIKAGDATTPVFIAHGLSGTVQVKELARHIQTGHAIYGIQARGVDGLEIPLRHVEDMAELYLPAVEALCPTGSCILIGYSFGGLVALEMSQRLLEKRKRVALLVMLDAYPHPRFMPFPWRMRMLGNRIKIHAREMRQMSPSGVIAHCSEVLNRRRRRSKAWRNTEAVPETRGLSPEAAALENVKEKAYVAYTSYRPRFYPGKITFVTTAQKTYFPSDPAAIWKHLAAGFEVETIPGNHLNIVTTEFHALADVLTRYLQQVPAETAR